IDDDVHPKGPNPMLDVTRYGARVSAPNATPVVSGINATTTSGSAAVTLSNASTFVNGDGVRINNAGATITMATPGAPTVTPSLAQVGTGTGIVVNGPTGATTYNYQIIACDFNGGCTTSSATGSTTTGAAALGMQSGAITSSSRSN